MSSSALTRLGSQTLLYGMGTILPRFLNYLLTPLLTYIFHEPAQFGLHTELYSYIAILNVIFTYGMETAYFRFCQSIQNPDKVFRTGFTFLILTTLIFSGILYYCTPIFATWLHYDKHPEFLYWSTGILASDALLALPMARFRQLEKPIPFTLIRITNILTNIVLHILIFVVVKNKYANHPENILYSWYNPGIGIGYSFLCNLLSNVLSFLMLIPSLRNYRPAWDFSLFATMIRYSWPLIIVGIAGMINETFDRAAMKHLLPLSEGQKAQGIYGACYKISIFMTLFIQAFRFAAEPFFFNRASERNALSLNAYVFKIFSQFCFFIFLLTALNLPLLQYFIGPSYREGIHIVPVLLLANAFLGIYYHLSIWYKLSGKTIYGAVISTIGAIITIVLNILFVPVFSYNASAWTTLIAYATICIISYKTGRKYYPAPYNLRAFVFYMLLSLFLYFLSFFWKDIPSVLIRTILNNLLVIPFVWIWIKWELPVLKKRHAEYRGEDNQSFPV
jgi:O-antigen/teichoic acid export membrane protein